MSGKSVDAPAPSALPRLLTITQVAAALAVARPTIYELVKRDVLPPPLKLGFRARFREDEVVAAIDGLRVNVVARRDASSEHDDERR